MGVARRVLRNGIDIDAECVMGLKLGPGCGAGPGVTFKLARPKIAPSAALAAYALPSDSLASPPTLSLQHINGRGRMAAGPAEVEAIGHPDPAFLAHSFLVTQRCWRGSEAQVLHVGHGLVRTSAPGPLGATIGAWPCALLALEAVGARDFRMAVAPACGVGWPRTLTFACATGGERERVLDAFRRAREAVGIARSNGGLLAGGAGADAAPEDVRAEREADSSFVVPAAGSLIVPMGSSLASACGDAAACGEATGGSGVTGASATRGRAEAELIWGREELVRREGVVAGRERDLAGRERDLAGKEVELAGRERDLASREEALVAMLEQLDRRSAEMQPPREGAGAAQPASIFSHDPAARLRHNPAFMYSHTGAEQESAFPASPSRPSSADDLPHSDPAESASHTLPYLGQALHAGVPYLSSVQHAVAASGRSRSTPARRSLHSHTRGWGGAAATPPLRGWAAHWGNRREGNGTGEARRTGEGGGAADARRTGDLELASDGRGGRRGGAAGVGWWEVGVAANFRGHRAAESSPPASSSGAPPPVSAAGADTRPAKNGSLAPETKNSSLASLTKNRSSASATNNRWLAETENRWLWPESPERVGKARRRVRRRQGSPGGRGGTGNEAGKGVGTAAGIAVATGVGPGVVAASKSAAILSGVSPMPPPHPRSPPYTSTPAALPSSPSGPHRSPLATPSLPLPLTAAILTQLAIALQEAQRLALAFGPAHDTDVAEWMERADVTDHETDDVSDGAGVPNGESATDEAGAISTENGTADALGATGSGAGRFTAGPFTPAACGGLLCGCGGDSPPPRHSDGGYEPYTEGGGRQPSPDTEEGEYEPFVSDTGRGAHEPLPNIGARGELHCGSVGAAGDANFGKGDTADPLTFDTADLLPFRSAPAALRGGALFAPMHDSSPLAHTRDAHEARASELGSPPHHRTALSPHINRCSAPSLLSPRRRSSLPPPSHLNTPSPPTLKRRESTPHPAHLNNPPSPACLRQASLPHPSHRVAPSPPTFHRRDSTPHSPHLDAPSPPTLKRRESTPHPVHRSAPPSPAFLRQASLPHPSHRVAPSPPTLQRRDSTSYPSHRSAPPSPAFLRQASMPLPSHRAAPSPPAFGRRAFSPLVPQLENSSSPSCATAFAGSAPAPPTAAGLGATALLDVPGRVSEADPALSIAGSAAAVGDATVSGSPSTAEAGAALKAANSPVACGDAPKGSSYARASPADTRGWDTAESSRAREPRRRAASARRRSALGPSGSAAALEALHSMVERLEATGIFLLRHALSDTGGGAGGWPGEEEGRPPSPETGMGFYRDAAECCDSWLGQGAGQQKRTPEGGQKGEEEAVEEHSPYVPF